MCGKEALNSSGLLSKKDAFDLLNLYINNHKFPEEDGFLSINEWFQRLIQDRRNIIHRNELKKFVDTFFDL